MRTPSLWQRTALTSAAALLGLFLLPAALIRGPVRAAEAATDAPEIPETPVTPITLPVETPPQTVSDTARTLRVLDGGSVLEMTLADYLLGVTAAEMPVSFELDALKAQAVAARTYTLYQCRNGGSHGDTADICTDAACCQAYRSIDMARADWGSAADVYEAKLRAAVTETDGIAILYDGAPILAAFHSSSAGQTRSAGQVWQNDLPYLQPVASPEDSAAIPNYYSRVTFTADELRMRLLAAFPAAELSGPTSDWLKDAVRDSAGSVETLTVGGVTARGSAVRAALGLRSACFEWSIQEDGCFIFYVTGYGHGVGLSQYGANALAKDSMSWADILTHYYTGVTLAVWEGGTGSAQ